MDDTAQQNIPGDNVTSAPGQQPASANAATIPGSKEHEAVATPEYVQPAPHEVTPAIPKEAAHHIEASVNPEQPQLSAEHHQLGISEAKEATPAPSTLSDDNAFPLTAAEVTKSQTKQYSVWDSFKWKGKTVGRQMLRAYEKLFVK